VAKYRYYSFIFLEGLRKTVDTSVKITNVADKIHFLFNVVELIARLSQTDVGRSAHG
jgi:hypothetical protein